VIAPATAASVSWQPIRVDACHWRVYVGQRQLGHVCQRVDPRQGYLASHIEPGGRRIERPFASLREAARFAVGGV
jgi:hypothetical protein